MGKMGGKRPGAGRKKGSVKKLLDSQARAVKLIGMTPAEFLDDKMNNSDDEAVRLEAAKALMPYVHKKQPEARELITPPDQADPRLAVAALIGLIGL